MKRCMCLLANTLIFISTLRAGIGFFLNLRNFRKIQGKKLKTLYEKNRETVFLKDFRLKSTGNPQELPLTDWNDYESHIRQIMKNEPNVLTKEKVLMLEPTSGTTSHTKYIPYTHGLRKEFKRAIQPWLLGLYLKWPSLFFSNQYWSISPAALNKNEPGHSVPVGFEHDSQYLGGRLSRVMDKVMTVPGQ
ncbi:MAG: GH3 auxin-responsive promoter family protein, partial [Bacteroidales bacterium]|nr:GH3 auxin-responsive promoter family protein [Bacteroidales bacterium]